MKNNLKLIEYAGYVIIAIGMLIEISEYIR